MPEENSTPTQVPADTEGRVAGDLSCIQCGYNLRTLHRDAKCPECGSAVGRSLRGDLLKYSDLRWLTKLARGLGLVFWMIVTAFAIFFAGLTAIQVAYSLGGHRVGSMAGYLVMDFILPGAFLVLGIVSVVGLCWFTTPEPNRRCSRRDRNLRLFIRLSASIAAMGLTVDLLCSSDSGLAGILRPIRETSLLGTMCCIAAVLICLQRQASRIPSRTIAWASRLMLIGFVFGIILTLAGMAGRIAIRTTRFFDVMLVAGGCLDFVLLLAFAILLHCFRRSLVSITGDVWKTNH